MAQWAQSLRTEQACRLGSSLEHRPPARAFSAVRRALHRIFNATVRHVYEVFDHLRDARSLEAWAPHFKRFAAAIHRGGKRSRRSRRRYPMPLNNCVGFIDGSNQYCDRPGRYQNILYNGHKRAHLVKWQGIMLPNGIMPMPFGPINGRHHDAWMMEDSGVVPAMRRACRRARGAHSSCSVTRRIRSRPGLAPHLT